jgi:tetratricopeptide (TPR) repeat protein
MGWFTHPLVLVLAILLLAQASHNLKREQPAPYVRWFGALTLLMVAFGCILYLLLMSGALVLSPEFGLVLVRGSVARVAAQVLIACLAIGAAIGWHTARLAVGSKPRLALLVGLGVTLALLSVAPLFVLDALNPQDAPAHRVYRYDIWWPPLLIWLSWCAVETTLTALKMESRQIRIWLVTVFVTALAYYALREPLPIDLASEYLPHSVRLWEIALAILIPFNMSLGTWLTLRLREEQPNQGRWKRIGITIIPAALGLFSVATWYLSKDVVTVLFLPWLVWIGWFALLALVAARRLYRAWGAQPGSMPQLSRPVLGFSILLLVLLVLSLTLPHIAYLSSSNPISVFTVVALSWVALAEAILPGPIRPLAQWTFVQNIRNAESPLRHVWDRSCTRLSDAGKAIWSSIKAIFSAEKWPVVLFKALIAIVAIIALSDIPHAGKTIIQPFKVSIKDKESASDRLGQITSDHLQHALMTLQQDLQPEDIEFDTSKQKTNTAKFVPPAETGASAFATSPALEIGLVKVPVSLIAGWVQSPMRAFLQIRVIDGTLYEDGTQHYSLLVGSTAGMSWKVSNNSGTGGESIARLADLLALQIMQTDSRSTAVPRTDKAFDAFRAGLAAWRNFKNQENWDALNYAIRKFHEATQEDPMFALAHYRLGVALLDDRQPGAATEAFRAAVKADPALVAGRLALATTLLSFDSYYYAPAAEPAPTSSDSAKRNRYQEAHKLLLQVVDSASAVSGRNLASAYYGLCRSASFRGDLQLAYFYCQRAVGLYAKLRASKGAEQQSRTDEAIVLNQIGVILRDVDPRVVSLNEDNWHCSAAIIDKLQEDGKNHERQLLKSPYSRAALHYFESAKELSPDDPVIRCNFATTAYVIGDRGPMETLNEDAAAHLLLANEYSQQARIHTTSADPKRPWLVRAYYRLALNEFHQAAYGESKPTAVNTYQFDAMNGYAYTFWQWRLNAPKESAEYLSSDDAEWAETYARQALLLAANKPKYIQAMARSTLGEVLLALARPNEAIEVLHEALMQAPRHPLFNEIRWDLAQAYICAAENDTQASVPFKDARGRGQQALPLLKGIRQDEQEREFRPFADWPTLINPAFYQPVCARNKDGTPEYPIKSIAATNGVQYDLHQGRPKYGSNAGLCDWAGVDGYAIDTKGRKVSSLWLHVWGGGINSHIRADKDDVVGLGDEPRNTRWYYFAQLEEQTFQPVSEVYAVETKRGCSHNLATLVFKQRKPTPSSP